MIRQIGISGKMTSGKTTVCRYLIERYGYTPISFATPIKWIAEDWFQKQCLQPRTGRSIDYSLDSTNELFHFLVRVFQDDYAKASHALDFLIESVLPHYQNMDWTVEKGDQWRSLLQSIGNGIRKEIDDLTWVHYMISQINPEKLYVCDDIRYQNEYKVLSETYFKVIRLNISTEEQEKRLLRLYGHIPYDRIHHISETDLDQTSFPYRISADQPLSSVLQEAVSIVEG